MERTAVQRADKKSHRSENRKRRQEVQKFTSLPIPGDDSGETDEGNQTLSFEDPPMSDGQGSGVSTLGLRFILVASLLLFLLATLSETNRLPATVEPTPALTQTYTNDSLIIPGTRIGPATLGLSTTKLEQILGRATLRPQGEGTVYLYPDHGLVIYCQDSRVFSVTTRSPMYKTRSGVGVGSDVNDVLRNLSNSYEMEGSPPRYVLHNWSEGWHIEIDQDKVTYLQITPMLTEGQR